MSAIKLAMADTQEMRHLFTYFIVGILILYSKNILHNFVGLQKLSSSCYGGLLTAFANF